MAEEANHTGHFGKLLHRLKNTYGWAALRRMPPEDLILLMQRSARTEAEVNAAQAFSPWIGQGLIELLVLQPRQRDQRLPMLPVAGATTTDALKATLRSLDRALALSRSERQLSEQHPGPAVTAAPSPRQKPLVPVLVLASVIGLAAAMAVTAQIARYRQEVMRQQAMAREQKAELDRVKLQLEEQQKAAATPPPAPSPPPLNRRSLPAQTTSARPRAGTDAPGLPSSQGVGQSGLTWRACEQDQPPGAPPRSGDTWWPVVGPAAALEALRRHCRGDAFLNKDSNVQVASFRDRSSALLFAMELTAEPGHAYVFRLGEPTIYD